jgi:hypothetical protein
MQSRAATVEQYLAELPEDRRAAVEQVRAVMRANLDPDIEEGMQYGMIGYYIPHRVYPAGYHCDPKQPLPFAGIASQKNYLSLYLGCVYGDDGRAEKFQRAWVATGKKLDMGKACIRFKRVEDLALDVIAETVRSITAQGFIAFYETAIKAPRRRPGEVMIREPVKPAAKKAVKKAPKKASAKPAKKTPKKAAKKATKKSVPRKAVRKK